MTSFFVEYIEGFKAYFVQRTFFDHVLLIVDIGVVALLIYYALVFIRGTKASKIVYGIVLLLGVALVGQLLQLETLNWVLKYVATIVAIAIPVVFQPELRRGLEKLGRTRLISRTSFLSDRKLATSIQELIKALRVFKENHVGALIVLQRETGLSEYVEQGVPINGLLSSKLLMNIFFPNSPLHDGAVIVKGDNILSAASVLPLAEGRETYTYGTRHRAAIGITEVSDAVAIVVSEERGTIALVYDGKVDDTIAIPELENKLITLLK
ncbi:diadenylate cyclase CdaA [Patescibacteria group bacterium]|nr:diadenylate cyclase CdaA [Patescibacteria group bacterium]